MQHEVWTALDQRWRAIVLLGVRLQNRYGPRVRGSLTRIRSTLSHDPSGAGWVDPYREEVRTFVPEDVLNELDLSAEQVKSLYEQVAIHGTIADPMGRFHTLFRMMPADRREKLEGAARRAHDAYDAADMIARFYRDLTGEILLRPDEIFDISNKKWKEEIYGRWPIETLTRADLYAELRRHDLWPAQVHLIVEGDTEEIVFRRMIEAMTGVVDMEEIGISIMKLGDVGRTRLRHELARMKRAARWAVLVVDDENEIGREVDALKRDGLLTEETTRVWSSFEQTNFSYVELVEIVQDLAARADTAVGVDPGEFERRYVEHRETCSAQGQHPKGAMTYLSGMVSTETRGAFRPDKTACAELMAERLLADYADRGESALGERPMLELIVSILRVA